MNRSTLTVNSSSFVKNGAEGNGGAISIWQSTAVINRSSSSATGHGGTSRRRHQRRTRIGSRDREQLFLRQLRREGGAVASQITSPIDIVPARTTLTQVTMVGNRASEGSNIWVDENDVNFKLRTACSSAATAGRVVKSPLAMDHCGEPGNFIEDGSCGSMAGGDPLLAEMTGSPAYFALLDGSPALDSADPRFCTTRTSLARPGHRAAAVTLARLNRRPARPAPTPVVPPPPCPLAQQITAANTDAPAGGCPAGSGRDIIRLTETSTSTRRCRQSRAR